MLTDVESFILARPECKNALEAPYFMIIDLVKQGALEMLELAEDGHAIGPEEKDGLDENELDDLIVDFAFEDTELGRAAADETVPQVRFAKMVGASDALDRGCRAIMRVMKTHKLNALKISELVAKGEIPELDCGETPVGVMLEMMEKSGVIIWDKGH